MRSLLFLLPLFLMTACTTVRQAAYDAEVDRLCAEDGGAVVYEQVPWPEARFNKYGEPKAARGVPPADVYGPEYLVRVDNRSLKSAGGAAIDRYQVSITRRSDNKLLGTSTWYVRAGGDWISGFQPSQYQCPSPAKLISNLVFVKASK